MKALTLQQPWATLIANGSKRIETRKWHPEVDPEWIIIASSKKSVQAARCRREPFLSALGGDAPLPSGSFLAVVHVEKFVPTLEVPAEDLEREGAFGDFRPGRWAWYFDQVIALPRPVRIPADPARKRIFKLNLWEVPDSMVVGPLAETLERIGAAA